MLLTSVIDGRTVRQTDKAATTCSPFGEHKNSMISLILSVDVIRYKEKQLSLYITETIQWKQLNN